MKIFQLTTAMAIVIAVSTSCSKSSDGTVTTPAGMQFQLTTSNPYVVVNKTVAGSIVWTSGSAWATETKLEGKQNSSQLEFKSSVSQQINLFASVIAGMGNISIPAGTYTEVEFKVTLNQNGSNPAMELNGTYTSGTGVVTPVVFSINSLFLLKAEQSNVVVSANTSITALTTLNLSLISAGITQAMLNSATVSGGKILISASSNINLYNIITNNFLQFHHVDVTHH